MLLTEKLFHFVSPDFYKSLVFNSLTRNPVSLVSFVSPFPETKQIDFKITLS
jgi:hypothetical protein